MGPSRKGVEACREGVRDVRDDRDPYLALGMGVVGILYIGSFLIEGLATLRYATGLLAIPFYLLAGVQMYRLGRPR